MMNKKHSGELSTMCNRETCGLQVFFSTEQVWLKTCEHEALSDAAQLSIHFKEGKKSLSSPLKGFKIQDEY